ncbi:outer membrane efflux protein [Sulfuricurvum kujiense DSM 16994]|uniref:Outer membrane efflux protein n=1 Tax=Sulfuricurvum kujiense (strain ATCC BAA-921 / DSM 16994 / JCM 11577 / YK-1) TaxID=709032 RepID=E4U130_SULKY|nr:TolC family protein [Sulfuricurvum kujiense]ADR34432.1 outer membrane efflux protein [Sulfuricurvum kujiense DSM 16994]
MRPFVLLSFTLLPLIASDLITLLPQAKSNLRVESARIEAQRAKEQLEQAKTAYFPTLDATALYQKKDKATAFEPRTIQGLELGTKITLFDGLRRESTIDAIHSSINSAQQSLQQKEQDVLFETIQAYYGYFNAKASLDAIRDKKTELSAQVERFSILVQNDLATSDILKSLIASKLQADYDEQNQKVMLERSRKNLELLTGSSVESLEYTELATPQTREIDRHDLKADISSVETLRHSEGFYTYLPTLSVQGKHREMDYNDYDTMGGSNIQPSSQNEIIASLSMTLFDMGSIAKEREQARLSTLKAQKLIEYKTKSIQNEADIARLSLQASQSAYDAAKSEEEARSEAFGFVKKRFEAGLVNTTTYLSELSDLSLSRAKVQSARHSLQMAKANLAYAYGTDLMTLIEGKQ